MNLSQMLVDYLAMRRGLGFILHSDGTALTSFVSFMTSHDKDIIITELALAWATLPSTVQPARWASRLTYVRGFARYCKAMDPRTEVPPLNLLSIKHQRPTPYPFTDSDIRQLLTESRQLSVADPFFRQVLYCLFGLLSITGLRISEALDLAIDDVDLTAGVLTVRHAKFGKSRLLPLHETTVTVLAEYGQQRKAFLAGQQSPYWFVGKLKQQLGYYYVKYHFDNVMKSIRSVTQTTDRKPRLHDLRHHFAISVLIRWYQNGQDVERCLPTLSAYLGHVETRDTYWYLSACPELMGAAKSRLEQHWEKTS